VIIIWPDIYQSAVVYTCFNPAASRTYSAKPLDPSSTIHVPPYLADLRATMSKYPTVPLSTKAEALDKLGETEAGLAIAERYS